MLYLVCPTCGYLLGKKTIEYENKKKIISLNPELTDEDKENEISKLLLSLNIRRYCCKMRMMTYVNIIDVIIPIKN